MDQTNLDIYGHPPIPWSRAERQLEAGHETSHFFLATVRPDGRPHVAGIGALWVDGKFYIVSGPRTRKSRNLAHQRRLRHLGQPARPRPRRRGHRHEGDRRADAPAPRRALRCPRLAGDGQGRRLHCALQRAERRATAMGPVRDHAEEGLRRGVRRAARRHALGLLDLTPSHDRRKWRGSRRCDADAQGDHDGLR